TIFLDPTNVGTGQFANNSLVFDGLLGGGEILTFGSDITLSGSGLIEARDAGDALRILGTVAGQSTAGVLNVRDIDNGGAALLVDTTAGAVALGGRVRDAEINGANPTTEVSIENGAVFQGVTLGADARIETQGAARSMRVEDGLALDQATLTLAGAGTVEAQVTFTGAQAVTGTGEIRLSPENAGLDGTAQNTLRFDGLLASAELLTFGAGITLSGQGNITAIDSGDALRILGQVAGEGLGLGLSDIDNGGAALMVSSSQGAVFLNGDITDTVLTGASASDEVSLFAATLTRVTLDLDADLGTQDATVFDGLTLNATLDLAGSRQDDAFLTLLGAQTIGGTGTIRLGTDNLLGLPDTTANQIRFDGVFERAETVSFGSDLTIVGTGLVDALDAGDEIDLDGTAIADGGRLLFSGLGTLDGTLGAEQGSVLEVQNALQLSPQAVLEIALGGAGDAASAGVIEVTGPLALGGTLRLDVAAGFAAETGTEFRIVSASEGFTGNFAGLAGFDFPGAQGFHLVTDGDDLVLRVVEGAAIGTVIDRAALPPEPDLPVLSGR
ncbi:MAG: hypothetical protein AAF908_11480, partial [Pseudomonadota bacterium]